MMHNLYLTLPSNTEDFASNTTSEFRVRLPNALELDGEWEMGLVEMQYPYSWNNVKGGYSKSTQDNWILVEMSKNNPYYKGGLCEVTVPPGSYQDVETLIAAMHEALLKWKPSPKPGGIVKIKKPFLHKLVKLNYDSLHKRVKIKLDTTAIKGLIIGKTLQYMLGFGGDRSQTFMKSVNFADYPPDITSGFNTLFVYCDLVQPQIVGNLLAPLLRTVPISGEYGSSIDKVFLSPHYLPLRNKTFDAIEIVIKDDTNQAVKFNFGKVIIKLHLRRKQQ